MSENTGQAMSENLGELLIEARGVSKRFASYHRRATSLKNGSDPKGIRPQSRKTMRADCEREH